jgi:hypothetical protein
MNVKGSILWELLKSERCYISFTETL